MTTASLPYVCNASCGHYRVLAVCVFVHSSVCMCFYHSVCLFVKGVTHLVRDEMEE